LDFGLASKRKFSYIESAQAHAERFNYIELPKIATKNKKSPVLTNYALSPPESLHEKLLQKRMQEPTRKYEVKYSLVDRGAKLVPFTTTRLSDLRKVEAIPESRKKHKVEN
jgi:hypothetical protein